MPTLNDDNGIVEGIQIGVDAPCIAVLRLQGSGQQFSTLFYLGFRAERGSSDNLRLKYEGQGDIQPPLIGYTTLETDIRFLMEKLQPLMTPAMTMQGVDLYNTNGSTLPNVFVGTVNYALTGTLINTQNSPSSIITTTYKDSYGDNFRFRVIGTGLDDSSPVQRYPTPNSNLNQLFRVFIDNGRFVSRYNQRITSGLNATYGQSLKIKKILGEKR